jgi:hypothetical protein
MRFNKNGPLSTRGPWVLYTTKKKMKVQRISRTAKLKCPVLHFLTFGRAVKIVRA